MAHITVTPGIPGIVSLFDARPETALALSELAETLLRRTEGNLAPADRELIAAVVSRRNDCTFCHESHAGAARAHLGDRAHLVQDAVDDLDAADLTPLLRSLVRIALAAAAGGKSVTDDLVAAARAEGATDIDIHDTVLIAAAFCMFNRYVDGLATWAPEGREVYDEMGQMLATQGYLAGVSAP